MKKKLFLHIGAHKTASTSLQRLLKDSNEDVKVISVHEPDRDKYVKFRMQYSAVIFNSESKTIEKKQYKQLSINLAKLFEQYLLQFNQETLIWSDENLIGTPIGHRIGSSSKFNSQLYPCSELIAMSFALLKERFDIKVLIVLRRQDLFLESCYRDWIIKLDEAVTMTQYLKRVDLKSLNWLNVISPWVELFEDRFRTMCFEELLMDTNHFYTQVFEWFELEYMKKKLKGKMQRANSGISSRQIEIANLITSYLKRSEKHLAQKFIRDLDSEDNGELLSKKIRLKLLKMHNSENVKLQEFCSSLTIEGYTL